jgi:hypothetical protein
MNYENLIRLGKKNPKKLIKLLKRELRKEGLVFNNLETQVFLFLKEVGR